MAKEKTGNLFFRILEWAALCAVMHYCFYQYFTPTAFKFYYDETFRTINYSVLVSLGVLRLITGLWRDFRQAGEKKGKIRVLIKGLLAVLCTVPCVMLTASFGYLPFVYLPFAVFCLYGSEPERVLKIHAVCIATLLTATILCSLSGAIENLVYFGMRSTGIRVRGTYGGNYPTGTAAYFVFLLLHFWCASTRKSSGGRTAYYVCLAILFAWGCYEYPWSATSAAICALAAIVFLYDLIQEKVLSRRKGARWITKTIDFLTIGAFPILTAATAGVTWLYSTGSTIGYRLNEILSERLAQMWNAFQKYGIQAFGAQTPQSGWGGNLIKTKEYEFLDNSFSLMFIRYGWIVGLIAMSLWMWTTYRAVKTGHRKIALAMAVILVHSFMEHRFPVISYNILLAMPLCSFLPVKETEARPVTGKKPLAGWIAGAAITAGFALLLPKLLSWVRCVVELKGWTGKGADVLPVLFGWLAALGGLAGLWFALRRIGCDLT